MAKEIKETGKNKTPAPTDPFTAMRAEMDRVFDNFMDRGWGATSFFNTAKTGALVPDIDVKENDNEIIIEAELPGMEEKDVEVSIRNGLLTIKGEKRVEEAKEQDDCHITERRHGSFQRSLRMPDTIDEDKIDASLEKGVLHLKLAKKPEAVSSPRKISIKQS